MTADVQHAETLISDLRITARSVWADYTDPGVRSELKSVCAALDFISGAFTDAAEQRPTPPVEAGQR